MEDSKATGFYCKERLTFMLQNDLNNVGVGWGGVKAMITTATAASNAMAIEMMMMLKQM